MRKQAWKYLAAIACTATLACNSGKAPAEAALKLADEAVASAKTAAEQFVPDDMKSLSDELAAAQDAFAKGDYKGALASAQSVQQKANEVTAKAMAKKEELTAAWNSMNESVPAMIEAVKSRVDALSKSRRLPKGLDAATFTSAKDGLAAATSGWSDAQAAFGSGNLTEAIAKATSVKDKATEVMGLLGMNAGQ